MRGKGEGGDEASCGREERPSEGGADDRHDRG